jgi:hypothetical protein
MAGILAIEPDRKRQGLLRALIGEHADADLTIVESVRGAVQQFADRPPDVIVAPTLLSPGDSELLMTHVRQHAAPHVQLLTIPALDMLGDQPSDEKRGRSFFRRRRPVDLGLQYDPAMVGTQVADRLECARVLRAEHDALAMSGGREASLVVRPARQDASVEPVRDAQLKAAPDRRVAHRTPQRATPWLWSVKFPWGMDVDLVNISRTGVLLESGSKVTPGVSLELQLSGPGLNRVVLAQFVRSEIARVNRLGVRYHAAARFETPLDILTPRADPTAPSTPHQLAELLASVLNEANPQIEPASIRFARGLRTLFGARDVLIRQAPIAPVDDSESIYFHVKRDGRSRAILQIMFGRDRELTAPEFTLLKAAASLTAAVLELERPVDRVVTESAGSRMSEVA